MFTMSSTTYWLSVFYCLASMMTSYSTGSYTPKKVVYMDRESTCNRVLHDDGLSEGDYYEIKSDKKIEGGLSKWSDQEYITLCPLTVSFGDRLIAIVLERWWCEKSDSDAYLAIYADCSGRKIELLKWLNSSVHYPVSPVYSPSSCVSLIYFRGRQSDRGKCHFEINVVARYELFPAFKISAIIVSSIVLLMILVKIVCVITGYERRLPNVNINVEEHKSILIEHSSTDSVILQPTTETGGLPENVAHQSSQMSSRDPERHDRLLSVRRSGECEVSGSTSSDVFDTDYFDGPGVPRLKRYASCKTSSIWGH